MIEAAKIRAFEDTSLESTVEFFDVTSSIHESWSDKDEDHTPENIREWGAIEDQFISDVVQETPRPRAFIDVGCGNLRHGRKNCDDVEKVLGIDISPRMLLMASKKIDQEGYTPFFGQKIQLLLADVRHMPDITFPGMYAVAAIAYQTLGNIPNDRVLFLQKVAHMVGKNGTIAIGCFNAQYFKEYGVPAYKEMEAYVGKITKIDWEHSTVYTDKNLYTHWFQRDELETLLELAGLSYCITEKHRGFLVKARRRNLDEPEQSPIKNKKASQPH